VDGWEDLTEAALAFAGAELEVLDLEIGEVGWSSWDERGRFG
jgi:hypothetical protein